MRLRKRDLVWLLPAAAVAWLGSAWRSLLRLINGEHPAPKLGSQAVRDD